MRVLLLISAAWLLLSPGLASAQEWDTFVSRADRFSITFPGEPKIETITWPSEYGAVFPGRVYTQANASGRYSVTVIDYRDAEKIHAALTKPESFQDPIYWQIDIQASIQYAATKFRMRPGAKVTYDAWHYIDLVEGHQLQLTNADQSHTFVAIYLHENVLYILEATVPPRAVLPGLFQQNLSFLDEAGTRVRHDAIYSNRLPPRTIGGRGGRGGGGGQGGGRGQQQP
jgi:hypothetical protein